MSIRYYGFFAVFDVIFYITMSVYFGFPTIKPSSYRNADGTIESGTGGYISMTKHVLLLFFTFGVCFLIWVYRVTDYLNCVRDEEPRNPKTKMLLMFVPFYSIYWVYKSAQRIDKLSAQKGIKSECTTLFLVLGIFIPILAHILMQDKINNLATAKGQAAAVISNTNINIGAADELKKYKELLDDGIITQEEFDAKKKHLLGL